MNEWEFPNPTSGALSQALEPDSKLAHSREARIQEVENEVHEEAAGIILDALSFADVPDDATQPPDEWIDKYGAERAMRRFRLAKHAQKTPKEAPVGLRLANNAMIGMAKVKAGKNAAPRTLNMIVVRMTGPVPTYEELEVSK